MSTAASISIHMSRTSEASLSSRIRTRHQNYNTWATAEITIDDHSFTVFLQSTDALREYASKLAGLSHALFLLANEQDIVAQAKEQASLVG